MSSKTTGPDRDSAQEASRSYKLVLLFDGSQVGKDALRRKVEQALAQISDRRLDVKKEGAKLISVHIGGTLGVVDKCHAELCDNLLSKTDLRYFRMTDEAGDEVRLRAYPILAGIEQQMRGFINRVMAEVSGFEYWKKWPSELQSRIAQLPDRTKTELSFDPLQYTQFGDLVVLLKVRCPTWAANRPLNLSDLEELLTRSKTIDDLRAALNEKTRVVSLWDNVFARYFGNPEDKDSLVEALDFVVEQRHKVMHHRPVRLGLLAALKNKEKVIGTLIGAAKEALSPKERKEAKADAEKLWLSLGDWAVMHEAFIRANPRTSEILSDAVRQFGVLQPMAGLTASRVRLAELADARGMSPELRELLAVSPEQLRRSLQLMAEAMDSNMEAARRASEHMFRFSPEVKPDQDKPVPADSTTPEKGEQTSPKNQGRIRDSRQLNDDGKARHE